MIGERFRLGVFQFAPTLREPGTNVRRIAEAASAAGAGVILTPELSLTGYDVGDDASALAVPEIRHGQPLLPELGRGADVVVGLIERGRGGTPYNAAVHLREGIVHFRHRKLYLPTYGMFDEARFFGRGERVDAYEPGGGWRVGLLVCEDFWHPGLSYLLAARGIQLLLVLAAAPGRGVWSGAETGGRFASTDVWERIARTTAQLYGIYVALANRVGSEGGVTFAGGSLIVAPTGEVVARAPQEGEAVITAELSLKEIERARRPYAHARDEDPHLMLRELERLLDDGADRE